MSSVFGVYSARLLFALTPVALLSACGYVPVSTSYVILYDLPPAKITQHLRNFVVLETSNTDFGVDPLLTISICREFYLYYEDEFDILVLMAHNPDKLLDQWRNGLRAKMTVVRNSEVGTGTKIFDVANGYGSEEKLRGVAQLIHHDQLLDGLLLHEIIHLWYANREVIPTTRFGHWGFSSVGGQLGGFQREELRSLGDGKYSAGNFSPHLALVSVPYSPLEMYLAGWIGSDDVPDIWVAEDGSWLMSEVAEDQRQHQTDANGNWIFTTSQISTWSIEQIIEQLGPRSPDFESSQKEFRVAFVLVTDGRIPIQEAELEEIDSYIEQFTKKGPVSTWFRDRSDESLYNFWEATRGIATLDLGDLQSFRK